MKGIEEMNKKLGMSILAIALSTSVLSAAAMDKLSEINWGTRAGLNFNKFTGSNSDAAVNNLGFTIGGTGAYSVNENVDIIAEANWSLKGSKTEAAGASAEKKYKIHYLQFPVVARYTFPQEVSGMKINVSGGFYGAYALSAKQDIGGTESDIKNSITSIDYGIPLSVGIAKDNMQLDLRYELGLKEISTELKNSTIQLVGGYKF